MNFQEMNERNHTGSQAGGDDAECGSGENAAHATKIAIDEADRAVRSCDGIVVAEMEKIGRKVHFETVVTALYPAAYMLELTNSTAEFLAERKVKPHGNVKNVFSLVLRGFTQGIHPLLRDRLSKSAAVIGLAYHQGVPPDEFSSWLKHHPLEKACNEYRRIIRERQKSRDDDLVSKILVDPAKEPDKAPLLPATPITWGHVGLKLAVVQFEPDGNGNFWVRAILHHNEDDVMTIVRAELA